MVTFYCSVIVVPNRFVNRKPIKALNMYDAYLQMNYYLKRLHRFHPIVLVERGTAFRYYDVSGKVL